MHIQSPITGRTNHEALATLYALLVRHTPSVGVLVAQAAAMVEAGDPTDALAVLSRLSPADVTGYQPYWVTLARAETAAGHHESALQSFDRAIGLTEDPAVRAYLRTFLSPQSEAGSQS